MTQIIHSVAMSYVKQSQPNFDDPAALKMISDFFERYISGDDCSNQLSLLLEQTVGSNAPFIKIQAVMNCSDTPIETPWIDYTADTSVRKKTHPWTPNEDTRLLSGILRFGLDNWVQVAKYVGNGRTRAQCAQRWTRGLDPRISKEQWTREEEDRLLSLIHESGNKNWTTIAASMGSRSDVQCRYHYIQMQRDGKVREDNGQPPRIPSLGKPPKLSPKIRQGSPPAIMPNHFNSNPIRQMSVPQMSLSIAPPQMPGFMPMAPNSQHTSLPPLPPRPRRHSAATEIPKPNIFGSDQDIFASNDDFDSFGRDFGFDEPRFATWDQNSGNDNFSSSSFTFGSEFTSDW